MQFDFTLSLNEQGRSKKKAKLVGAQMQSSEEVVKLHPVDGRGF